jgi:beta-lactamase class D
MFVLESKAQLEKAIIKAKKTRSTVKFIAFGVYQVSGSKGNFYTVECKKVGNEKQVICGCKAGESNLPCYHAASALSLHVGLAKQRKEPASR